MADDPQPLSVAPTQELQLADLESTEYNFNVMDAAESAGLDTSLAKFGVVEYPVVNMSLDRRGRIVGGEHRITKALTAGQTSLPCIVVELGAEDERELSMRLNKHRGRPEAELVREFFATGELAAVGYTPNHFAEWDMMAAGAAADLDAAGAAAGTNAPPPVMVEPPADGAAVFTPAVPAAAAGLGVKPVTADDVAKTAAQLDGKFAGQGGSGKPASTTGAHELVCPHCGQEFSFDA